MLALGFSTAVGAVPSVSIPEDTSVTSAHITLGEVASFQGLEPDVEAALAALVLGPAATPGGVRSFAGEALRRRIAPLAGTGTRILVPLELRVHTAYRPVTPEWMRARITSAIHHRMTWARDEIELAAWRVPEPFKVAVGATLLDVRFRPGEDFLGRVNLELLFRDPLDARGKPLRRQASVEAIVRRDVVVMRTDVRRGRPLTGSALHTERRDLRKLPRDVVTDIETALGIPAAHNLARGATLTRNALQRANVIRRGDLVQVDVTNEALELRVDARAVERGAIGDTIRVENPTTRQRFLAIITGSGTARIARPAVGSAP